MPAAHQSKQITVRVPDTLARFVEDRATMLHETITGVVVAALLAAKRQCEIDAEIAAYEQHPDDDFVVLDRSRLAQVLGNLD